MKFEPDNLAVICHTKFNSGVFVQLIRYLGDGEDAGNILKKEHVIHGPVPICKNNARMKLWEVRCINDRHLIYVRTMNLKGGFDESRYIQGPMAEEKMKIIGVDMKERRGNDALRQFEHLIDIRKHEVRTL